MYQRASLSNRRFEGFIPLSEACGPSPSVPNGPGVYVVLLPTRRRAFLERSSGGHFKGSDPTVQIAKLEENWVEGVETVYIGRANRLHARLRLLARYGRGEPVAHRGGRLLWQLADKELLVVAWRNETDPVSAESELLAEFEATHGQLPFANLVRGTSMPLAA